MRRAGTARGGVRRVQGVGEGDAPTEKVLLTGSYLVRLDPFQPINDRFLLGLERVEEDVVVRGKGKIFVLNQVIISEVVLALLLVPPPSSF